MTSFTDSPVPAAAAVRAAGKKHKDGQSRKSYGKTAKVGALWSVMRQGGNELISIPTSMVMARLLSPSDFGIAAAAAFFILMAARLTQFGFNAAIVRVKVLTPEHSASVFVVNLGLGTVSYAVLAGAAPWIGQFFRSPEAGQVLPYAALTFLINPFGSVAAALMQRNMQFRQKAVADWVDTIVSAGGAMTLAFMGFGFWSLVYGNIAGAIVRVIVQIGLSGWRPRLRFSRQAMHDLLSFGLGIQSKRLLEFAAFNLDNLVVGRVLGITALGFYDKAFTTMNRIVNRLTLGQSYFRIFSIIHEEPERFRRAYGRLILTVTLIGLPAFSACIVMAEPLFRVMYGDKWLPAVLPFQLLCAGGILKLLNAYASQANEAVGNVWPQVRRQGAGAVLIVIGAAVGSKYGGVAGAAFGVLVAMILLTAAMQQLVRRSTGLTWTGMLRPQIPGATCAVLLSGLLIAVAASLKGVAPHHAPWQLLAAQLATAGLGYAAFVLFSPFAAVQDLVTETLDDLLPPGRLQVLNWRRRAAARLDPPSA